MIEWFEKLNIIKNTSIKNVFIITIMIIVLAVSNYAFLIDNFVESHENIVHEIYQDYLLNHKLDNIYITDNYIYIIDFDKEKYFELKHNRFIEKDIDYIYDHFDTQSKIKLNNTVYIELPHHIIYKFNNIVIEINAEDTMYLSSTLISFLIFATIIMYFIWSSAIKKKDSKINNLTISSNEYALSERTTSYFVNIMHHKLNTPLKVLATKSRMLIETIVTEKSGFNQEIIEKSEWDYLQIDNALKTIFSVTNKLKTYNELSQNESNLYKLCTIAKETIDVLKDDDFHCHIDYKAKLYDIDKSIISSHEIIQIFIHQIKFSLSQLAEKINFTIYNNNTNSITILYTDNGNIIDNDIIKIINESVLMSDLLIKKIEGDYYDLILNFNILNSKSDNCNIRILSSNETGNVFEIKLPTFKHNFDKDKKKNKVD